MSPPVGFPGSLVVALAVAGSLTGAAQAQFEPYNPYAVTEAAPAPVSPAGTIQWGTFYKSAALERRYEDLWNIGACRGTFKAITIRVAENKLKVDSLPEARFVGTVRGATGGLAGGLIAFATSPDVTDATDPPFVVQLHPAGVTRLSVTGTASPAVLRPGMTVRVATRVDSRGHATDAVTSIDVMSPDPRDRSTAVMAGEKATVVGTVTNVRRDLVGVRVDAGRIRRLTLPLAANAAVTIDAAAPELVAGGDAIEVTGRLWSGQGAMGAGTIFASDVVVRKPGLAR